MKSDSFDLTNHHWSGNKRVFNPSATGQTKQIPRPPSRNYDKNALNKIHTQNKTTTNTHIYKKKTTCQRVFEGKSLMSLLVGLRGGNQVSTPVVTPPFCQMPFRLTLVSFLQGLRTCVSWGKLTDRCKRLCPTTYHPFVTANTCESDLPSLIVSEDKYKTTAPRFHSSSNIHFHNFPSIVHLPQNPTTRNKMSLLWRRQVTDKGRRRDTVHHSFFILLLSFSP